MYRTMMQTPEAIFRIDRDRFFRRRYVLSRLLSSLYSWKCTINRPNTKEDLF